MQQAITRNGKAILTKLAIKPTSMSDAKLAADIGELGAGDAIAKPIADELVRALRQGPSFFRKELWRHDLSSGLTTITELGRDGAKGRSVTRSSARLMSTLYLSLTHCVIRSDVISS